MADILSTCYHSYSDYYYDKLLTSSATFSWNLNLGLVLLVIIIKSCINLWYHGMAWARFSLWNCFLSVPTLALSALFIAECVAPSFGEYRCAQWIASLPEPSGLGLMTVRIAFVAIRAVYGSATAWSWYYSWKTERNVRARLCNKIEFGVFVLVLFGGLCCQRNPMSTQLNMEGEASLASKCPGRLHNGYGPAYLHELLIDLDVVRRNSTSHIEHMTKTKLPGRQNIVSDLKTGINRLSLMEAVIWATQAQHWHHTNIARAHMDATIENIVWGPSESTELVCHNLNRTIDSIEDRTTRMSDLYSTLDVLIKDVQDSFNLTASSAPSHYENETYACWSSSTFTCHSYKLLTANAQADAGKYITSISDNYDFKHRRATLWAESLQNYLSAEEQVKQDFQVQFDRWCAAPGIKNRMVMRDMFRRGVGFGHGPVVSVCNAFAHYESATRRGGYIGEDPSSPKKVKRATDGKGKNKGKGKGKGEDNDREEM